MDIRKTKIQDVNLFEFADFDELKSEHIAAPRYSYWKSVWRTFFRNKFTVAVAVLLLLIIGFALIQPMYSGYSPIDTPNINTPEMKFQQPSGSRGQRGLRRGVGRRPELHYHQLCLYGAEYADRHSHRRPVGILQEDGPVDD